MAKLIELTTRQKTKVNNLINDSRARYIEIPKETYEDFPVLQSDGQVIGYIKTWQLPNWLIKVARQVREQAKLNPAKVVADEIIAALEAQRARLNERAAEACDECNKAKDAKNYDLMSEAAHKLGQIWSERDGLWNALTSVRMIASRLEVQA